MSYVRPMADVGRAVGAGLGAVAPLGAPSQIDQIAELARQVNRFGPEAPPAYRFLAAPLPVASGNLTPELALVATTIFQRKATDSYNQFHDTGSLDAIARANTGLAAPVPFVAGNLTEVLSAVTSFANALGLPGGGIGGAVSQVMAKVSPTMLLAGGIGVIGVVLLASRKGRR